MRLPERVELCPIVEAFFEIRFSSTNSWETWPGMLYAQIKDRYPIQQNLPTEQIPLAFRQQDPLLIYAPLIQFVGDDFVLRLGPRSICLATHSQKYPGWNEVSKHLEWILNALKTTKLELDFERLGVRYVDFFEGDVFKNTIIEINIAGEAIESTETVLATAFKRDDFTITLKAVRGAIFNSDIGVKTGCVLDLDISLESLDFDLFVNGMNRFEEAHKVAKESFFGLLTESFLGSLNPQYS